MPTPSRRPHPRALQPRPEALEARRLLSTMISGNDVDGDTWTLRLIGPGDLRVVKQNGPDGNPALLNSQSEINTIEVAGADPLHLGSPPNASATIFELGTRPRLLVYGSLPDGGLPTGLY